MPSVFNGSFQNRQYDNVVMNERMHRSNFQHKEDSREGVCTLSDDLRKSIDYLFTSSVPIVAALTINDIKDHIAYNETIDNLKKCHCKQ